jgi:hypothetical protein
LRDPMERIEPLEAMLHFDGARLMPSIMTVRRPPPPGRWLRHPLGHCG